MRTFERYFINFMCIGLAVLAIIIILLAIDGGELLVPVFLVAVTFADMLFVVGMSFVFSIMAAPRTLKFAADENMDIEEKILRIAEQKWRRKRVIKEDGRMKIIFGNKYKDWLTTSVELIKKENFYTLNLPSAYVEDVRNIRKIDFL